jgi:16S rRNA (adenine1518-N6/adenine1519-N6)-dimethyltransferase
LLQRIEPRADQVFVEIGAGAGALTLPLATRARRVVAVELDTRWADHLRRLAPANVEVVNADALEIDLRSLLPVGGRIVGNLPYAISSPLLRRFLDLRDRALDLNVLLQREVADRLAATCGSKDYGILSVLYGVWAATAVPLRFGPGCFVPPPKVDSALFQAQFRPQPESPVPPLCVLESLLKSAFAQRRKTLENNLRGRYPNLKQHLRLLNILGSRRAETLSIDEFVGLGLAIASEKAANAT